MVSQAQRLLAWFSPEPERRARARRVVKEGLTRGGYFLMGLLLAWLWMMLIGRGVTNRCWLPGAVLRWRHRDGSHKVIDIRLSGLYNGSRVIPFNATLEEIRRLRVSKPMSRVSRRRKRSLQETPQTDNREGREDLSDVFSSRTGTLGMRDGRGVEMEARGLSRSRESESQVLGIRQREKGSESNARLAVGPLKPEAETGQVRFDQLERKTHRQRQLGVASNANGIGEDDLVADVGAGGERKEGGEQLLGGRVTAVTSGLGASRRLQVDTDRGVSNVVTLGKDGKPLIVITRPHPRTRLKNLVFGIAATAATWSERKEILRLWWDPGRLRGYVWMDTPDLTGNNCTKSASSVRDPHVKASLLWEPHLAVALKSLNRTCGTGKKIDYSWLDHPDPSLPPVVFSANFSRYAYTHPTGLRSAIRVARVAVEMYRVQHDDDALIWIHPHQNFVAITSPSIYLEDVFWYVMGDDDTIFSPPNLASVLSKYDPREMVYVGAPSESHLQNVEFSNEMGYGGGGFAISYALAARLSQIQDECLHRYPEVYGSDARVQACLSELGVQMRKERGFHQYDILGNIAGALEGHPVTPFLSMHHVAVFQPVFPRKSAMAALVRLTRTMKRHPREFLQQTMCLNQAEKFTISIAWGYSVRWFPDFIRPTELERPQRTFRAWNRGREPFDFDMDTRKTLATTCRVPSLFHSSGAASKWENGKLLLETSYTRTVTDWLEQGVSEEGSRKSSGKMRTVSKACPEGEVHIPQREVTEIRVVAPPLTDSWVLAPRRQCCQSVEFVDESTVEIRVDTCRRGQTIS